MSSAPHEPSTAYNDDVVHINLDDHTVRALQANTANCANLAILHANRGAALQSSIVR